MSYTCPKCGSNVSCLEGMRHEFPTPEEIIDAGFSQKCPICNGNPELARIAMRMGHRPDVAYAKVQRLEIENTRLKHQNIHLCNALEEAGVDSHSLLAGECMFEMAVGRKDDVLALARDTLQLLVDEKVNYMTINYLSDPEKQHSIKQGRATLATIRRELQEDETVSEVKVEELSLDKAAEAVIKSYTAYLKRGMLPAPDEYIGMVEAIKELSKVLNRTQEQQHTTKVNPAAID